MGFNLSGGYAAGGGADALETLLKQAFIQQAEKRRAGQEDRRIAISQQNADDNSALRKIAQADRADAAAATQKLQAQTGALKTAGTLRIGQELTPQTQATLAGGGLDETIKAPTLGSRNIGAGMASTPNPGKGASYLGTADQQDEAAQNAELQRQIAIAPPALRGRLSMASLLSPDKRAGAISEVMREEAKPTAQPVMRVNPRTGKMEQVGEAPIGAHFVNEPAPKDTSAADAGRADRSYQYNATQLEKMRKPFDDAAMRLTRLHETLAQGSPQADALVAPELLTVMAGGQGSGLRMNEAEIARVIGGRSKWQDLQAAAQKWSLDPKAANSITPEQRTQIRALVAAVDERYSHALKALDDAGDELVGATAPEQHRQILNRVRKSLSSINTATAGAAASTQQPAKGGFSVVEVK